ncbi:hypothetical protein OOT46_05355 [Aquabacterium sp. A7-Y]|uniref:hypothetical protein n=1 Tax=Aquabacterium sp. A7-Y TaxID=1349605 RepID=UPI00223D974E|nr:hypothetical protein [Aquabacterium sp. A7-Y]MCW7537277.1 hypothetical protein [Aquabacterium sp. A7-Y]
MALTAPAFPGRQAAQPGWAALQALLRSPRHQAAFGVMLALLLLLAFHQVLAGAVLRAEQARAAAGQRAEAAARCTDEPAAPLRDLCQASVQAGLSLPGGPATAGPAALPQVTRASVTAVLSAGV